MKFFIKLKAWQLFMLLFAPMVLPVIFVASGPSGTLFGITWLILMFIVIGWLYSVGSTSNKLLPVHLQKNTFIYKTGYSVPFIYGILLTLFFFPTVNDAGVQQPPAWMLPLHLLSMLGMFYGLYFTAKQFTALKNNAPVKFLDYSGPFFLMWFFPVGLWFLQPIINKLLDNEV